MDRFNAMTVLMAVVQEGNLSAAGRKLGVPLTTVSRKVADLESHLGARLLQRSNRSVALTDAGKSYVEACKRILAQVAEAEAAASGAFTAVRGELTVTAPVVFGRLHVLPVVTEFLRAYPDIDIRLMLADRMLHLQDDHVDLAVRIGTLPDSSLKAVRVSAVRRVVCASPDYLAIHGTPFAPEDLAHHACVTFTGLGNPDRWTFSEQGTDKVVAIRSRLAVTTAEAAIDAAVAGLGVTRVLSYQAAAAKNSNLLRTILEPFEPAAMPVSLVYDGQGTLPLKLRAFLDFAAPKLKGRLAAG
ncbi:LysR family transcriptional regulator [Tabrizicola sp. BL-A-41-H6]|uniref:LysR family transcriptional regulator n=1 Tax=Tabrizicola sp. BL-A-41-H6 TaxID=3421107 RepID=UPI003D67A70B